MMRAVIVKVNEVTCGCLFKGVEVVGQLGLQRFGIS